MAYRRLGDYIKEVNVRNNDLEITNPMGINIDKYFMPSVANVIGTDLSTYKLVNKNQFACNLMHVGRDERIPMALHIDDAPIIVSPAYFVFEIIQNDILLPEYLMIWFRRPEFDRNAWFYTDADVRGGLSKEAFLDMSLPIPSIEEQRKIVAEFQAVEQRIENNNRLIKALEDTAQTIYHHTFVENIDPENLPEGWKRETVEKYFGNISIGKTPPRENVECFRTDGKGIKWVSIADMKESAPYVLSTNENLTKDAVSQYNIKVVPTNTILLSFKMTVGRVAITSESMCTNEAIAHFVCKDEIQLTYTYCFLKNFDYKKLGSTSSITDAINSKIVKTIKIVIPTDDVLTQFSQEVSSLLQHEYLLNKENKNLDKLKNLLLSKLS